MSLTDKQDDDGDAEIIRDINAHDWHACLRSGEFDLIIEATKWGTVGLVANEVARKLLSQAPVFGTWYDMRPRPELPHLRLWKYLEVKPIEGAPENPAEAMAKELAENTSLRVGIMEDFGRLRLTKTVPKED